MFEIVYFTMNARDFGGFVKAILSNWELFRELKVLLYNESIAITKPDKASGVGVLNRYDYMNKMSSFCEWKKIDWGR